MGETINLVIFGGSFDPPHLGHERIIKELCNLTYIDRVIILPTFISPFKDDFFFPPPKRLIWLREIAKIYPKARVSSYEISRQTKVPTIDSLHHFKAIYKPSKIFIAIGADNLASLHLWKNIEELNKEAEFIIFSRDDIFIPPTYKQINIKEPSKSRLIQQNFIYHMGEIPISILKDVENEFSSKCNKEDILEEKTLQNMPQEISRIKYILETNKAEDITIFDLSNKEYICKNIILATSLGEKHSYALLDYLSEDINKHIIRIDSNTGDWIIIDLGDTMVHIFTESHRKKFNLDEFLLGF